MEHSLDPMENSEKRVKSLDPFVQIACDFMISQIRLSHLGPSNFVIFLNLKLAKSTWPPKMLMTNTNLNGSRVPGSF